MLGLTRGMDAHDLQYKGDAARSWLREISGLLRPQWKFIELQWFPQTQQQMQDERGQRQLYGIPPRFILTYYRTRFRFFGGMQRTTVEFTESEVYSVSFSRSRAIALWEAYYYTLRITLMRASIELTSSPALSGATPIASARRSEDMRIDGANGHPPRVHVLRNEVVFTATLARSRWPSLILFSLGPSTT